MIISEDHILQEELNNLTRILLARAYPLQLFIKNIKKALTRSRNNLLSQRTPHTETNILPIVIRFSDIGNLLSAIIHRNWSNVADDTALFGHPNPYQPITNPAIFITTLLTMHKHIAPHSRISGTATHTPPHTRIQKYPQWYTHGDITTVVTIVSSSILDTLNSFWYYGQLMERRDMLWRSWYHLSTMGRINALTLMLIT